MNENKIRQRWYGNGPVSSWHRLGAQVFGWLAAFRRKLFAMGLKKTKRLKVPVIIVGNITAGGGGKTPMVIWLAEKLQSRGRKPGIISRGYGGKRKVEPMFVTANANPAASGDEPLLMAKKTKLPVMVGKDRHKAGQMLINNYSVDVIVADDGLQHYALHRDAEIVMLDAKWGTGNEQLIPAGPLREPVSRLEQADLVVYKGQRPDAHHYEFAIDGIHKLNHPGETKSITELRNQKVLALAGIANPDSFFTMLAAAGLAVVKKPMPDHHALTLDDFSVSSEKIVLITEKDAVKCEGFELDHVWVVTMKISMPEETEKAIDQLLDEVLS